MNKKLIVMLNDLVKFYSEQDLKNLSKTKAAFIGSTSIGFTTYFFTGVTAYFFDLDITPELFAFVGLGLGALFGLFAKLVATPVDEWFK